MDAALLLFAAVWLPPGKGSALARVEEVGGPVASAPAIAVASDGSTLLAWEESAGGERWIAFRRRSPGSEGRWSEGSVRLDGAPAGSQALEPRLAIAGERAFLAWQDDRLGAQTVFVRRSTDLGRSWPFLEERLDPEAAESETSSMASLGARGDRLVAVWEARGTGERVIRARMSAGAGATWNAGVARLDSPGGASYHPQAAAFDDGSVLVVWWDEADGLSDLMARTSANGGAAWDAPIRLDPGEPGGAASRDASLASHGRFAAVAWEDESGGLERETLVRLSPDAGRTWGAGVALGRPQWAGAIEDPKVALDDRGRAHVFWVAEPRAEPHAPPEPGDGALREPRLPSRGADPSAALFHAIVGEAGVQLAPQIVPAAAPHSRLFWVGAHGRTTWAAWGGTRTHPGGVEAAATTDGGRTWRAAGLPRSQNPGGEFVPVIALAGAIDPRDDSLHLVWSQGRASRERLLLARLPIPLAPAPDGD